ncbi:MAG: DEAD/DEAH box helicase, partial [Lentisphaerae bacterium]|nr:DEAD/DEAH box helicase [Lentisphaerota bacterium]
MPRAFLKKLFGLIGGRRTPEDQPAKAAPDAAGKAPAKPPEKAPAKTRATPRPHRAGQDAGAQPTEEARPARPHRAGQDSSAPRTEDGRPHRAGRDERQPGRPRNAPRGPSRDRRESPADTPAPSADTPPPDSAERPPRSRGRGRSRRDGEGSPGEAAEPNRRAELALPDMSGWDLPPVPEHDDDVVCFRDLGLHPRIMRALIADLHFSVCTPIQGLALPFSLADADLAGQAQTGTGKTAAYLITILQRFLNDHTPRQANQPFALVLAPTRELADQVEKDAHAIGAYCGIHTLAVYGGVDYDRQRDHIATGLDIVAATPGRLIDYLRQDAIDLSRVQVLVIDEADRMLDMGFIPDVRRIIARVPSPGQRQTLLFSATLSKDILRLAQGWMRPDPVTVEVDAENIVADGIEERVYVVSSHEKLAVLLWILRHEEASRVLIFRNRRRDVEDLYADLVRYGVRAEMLSGDVSQNRRMKVLEQFRRGEIPVVVATDVAGRGIHIENVTHVINYDFPFEAEDYVHRIGRTGRAGKTGQAISFAGEDCAFVIPDIEAYIERPLPCVQPTDEMLVMPPP